MTDPPLPGEPARSRYRFAARVLAATLTATVAAVVVVVALQPEHDLGPAGAALLAALFSALLLGLVALAESRSGRAEAPGYRHEAPPPDLSPGSGPTA